MSSPLLAHLADQRVSLAERWQRALIRTGTTSYSATEVRERLVELVDAFHDALVRDAGQPAAAQIGAALAQLGYRSPEALGATIELFSGALSEEDQTDPARLRAGVLLAGFASGFSAATREQLLTEQEASRAAVLAENRRAWESLRRQAALLDLAPDAIVVRTAGTGRVVFWNGGAESLYGWSRDAAIGQSAHALLRTESTQPLDEIEAMLFRDGRWEGELVHTRRDGSRLIVASRWAAQLDEQGLPLACLEINTDITARKHIEATLREREASLETAQFVAHLGSWEFRLSTFETFWSSEAHRLLGYTEGEMRPSLDAYLAAVHSDDLALVRRAVEDAIGGNTYPFEHRTSALDGVERVLQSRSEVELDATGQPVRLVGTLLDITDRKRAEAERLHLLSEQAARAQAEAERHRFAFLAEASSRLASSLDLEITLRNVADLTVPTLADVCTVDIVLDDGGVRRVAQSGLVALPDEGIAPFWSAATEPHPLGTALRTGSTALYRDLEELGALLDPDSLAGLASVGIRSVLVAPLVARGRVLGAITCFAFRERGAYTHAEYGLADEVAVRCALAMDNARLHAEAQHATRLRDEFLSVAAHELKTPMTTLRGYTQVLGRTLASGQMPSPALLERSVHQIDIQSAKLVKLTEQLLDVSRLEAGKLSITPAMIDVVDLVRGVASSIQETTDRHTIRVIAPEKCIAAVDPMRLEQVVANLIGNAVKYSPDGGDVEVTLSEPESTRAELAVRDWGLGIPPERRDDLFDRFYQAHGEGHYGGLGLGLYVSQQIVELHGGTISARFPDDGGCCFVVSLPR